MPQPSSSATSKLAASKGEEPMRPTCSTRSDASTARVLAASTIKPVAVAVSEGSSQQVSVTANGSPRRATTDTSTARRRSTSRLSAALAASIARWLRITRTRQPSGMLRGTRHSITSPAAASSAAMVVRNWSNSSSWRSSSRSPLPTGSNNSMRAMAARRRRSSGLSPRTSRLARRLPSTVPTIWPRLLERS